MYKSSLSNCIQNRPQRSSVMARFQHPPIPKSCSRSGKILHIPEILYNMAPADSRLSGEKNFDYVDPKNREVQSEMEQVCNQHLKHVGAWLPPVFQDPDFEGNFPVEMSVVIPVRNREKTISYRTVRNGRR